MNRRNFITLSTIIGIDELVNQLSAQNNASLDKVEAESSRLTEEVLGLFNNYRNKIFFQHYPVTATDDTNGNLIQYKWLQYQFSVIESNNGYQLNFRPKQIGITISGNRLYNTKFEDRLTIFIADVSKGDDVGIVYHQEKGRVVRVMDYNGKGNKKNVAINERNKRIYQNNYYTAISKLNPRIKEIFKQAQKSIELDDRMHKK